MKKLSISILCILIAAQAQAMESHHGKHSSRISDEVIPLQTAIFPDRPKPLLEIGNPFLGTGPISEGFTIPTGAVWQPSFMVYGNYRSAVQKYHDGNDKTVEWANRFDIFGNLYLTPTERILVGLRFLDKKGQFSGYTWDAPDSVRSDSGSDNALNGIVRTLFFEGDLGELFPKLDLKDRYNFDVGFSVGRQLLNFQDGMLINDNVDALGLTKINIRTGNVVNMRNTIIWGGNELNRKNLGSDDSSSNLYGIFNEIDWRSTTLATDVIYIEGGSNTGDGIYSGISATQRLGRFNTTFRALNSTPLNKVTDHNSEGWLLFSQLSWHPYGSDDHAYINMFKAVNHYRSASRDIDAGGPLGQVGLLFEAVGLGRFSAALNNNTDDAFGGALGYQKFFDEGRKQIIAELGGHYANNSSGQRAGGGALSYRMAIGQRTTLRLDGFLVYDDNQGATSEPDDLRTGVRLEISIQF